MDGITIEKGSSGSVICLVNAFSDDLKNEIRNKLSGICFGAAKASSENLLYTYKNTLKEFLKRYTDKPDKTKKGMIGELLSHILLIYFFKNYSSINPYFNMEEESIKKAFDLVLTDNESGELWFSEVKSGELDQKTSIQKSKELLSTAKGDLKEKLNSSRFALWQNAINGAEVAMRSGDAKTEIIKILEAYNLDAIEEKSASSHYNAILISVLYNDLADKIGIVDINEKHNEMFNKKEFKELITFAIQKTTYQAVVDFLTEEANDA